VSASERGGNVGRRGLVDLFGPFVQVPDGAVGAPSARAPATRRAPPPEPSVPGFETAVVRGTALVHRRRSVTWPCSVALHAVGAAIVITLPLLISLTLPAPSGGVRAFFVEPMAAPPPPPPPPPPASVPAVRAPAPAPVQSESVLTAPLDVPAEIRPEEGLDLGLAFAGVGGVEGGVPGGVPGGVVGGLPSSSAPAPPPLRPVWVGGHVKEPRKVHHVDPVYPRLAADTQIEGVIIVKAMIDETGQVRDASVLKGIPLLDHAALEAVRQWRYTPTLVDGVPMPIVLVITVTFELRPSLGG
jgi:protein TonB